MRAYNPRTHVFSYGGTTKKGVRERHALDEFCKWMRAGHRASYRVVRVRDALRRGEVVSEGGSTVDGVLRTSRGLVAVELLSYSPVNDRGDVMARDFALRKVLKRALYKRLRAKCYSLSLGYRERRRAGPPSAGMVRTVPHTRDFGEVVKELRTVIAEAPRLDFNEFLSIHFVNAGLAARVGRRNGYQYVDATRFPLCADSFAHARLQGLRPWMIPDVASDLKTGFVGIDEEWVRKHLATKADKSLHASHERANGLPLWLIVHSDGHAIHQSIHETLRARALELCREVLDGSEHGFARAYWADRTAFMDAAWVGRAV